MTPVQRVRYWEAVDSDRAGAELEELIRVAGKHAPTHRMPDSRQVARLGRAVLLRAV